MPSNQSENKTNQWLKDLQDKSWEPEILISGIVIFGLFKIFPLVEDLHTYFDNYGSAFLRSNTFDNIIAVTKISIAWLIAGFIIHLFLRSFWVAYIGLSYVYGENFDYKKLKFKKRYEKGINKENNIKSNIEKLEKICSSIFSISILLFMNFIGLVLLLVVIGSGVFFWLELFPEKNDFTIFTLFIYTSVFLYLFDYVSSGLLKRIPYINKIFYPIYKVISFITLAPLYRKIYYTFISNHSKWKVFLALFFLILTSSVLIEVTRNGLGNGLVLDPNLYANNAASPKSYLDQANEDYSQTMWIPDQKVKSQTLEAFVVHTSGNESAVKNLCDFETVLEKYPKKEDSIKLDCLNQFYELELNSHTIKPEYFYTKSEVTMQDGLRYFINIDSLKKRKHTLMLYYNYYNSEEDTINKRIKSKIEFYKESPKINP